MIYSLLCLSQVSSTESADNNRTHEEHDGRVRCAGEAKFDGCKTIIQCIESSDVWDNFYSVRSELSLKKRLLPGPYLLGDTSILKEKQCESSGNRFVQIECVIILGLVHLPNGTYVSSHAAYNE